MPTSDGSATLPSAANSLAHAFKKAAHNAEETPLPTAVDKDGSVRTIRILTRSSLQHEDDVAEATVPDTCPREAPSSLVDDNREVQAGRRVTLAEHRRSGLATYVMPAR